MATNRLLPRVTTLFLALASLLIPVLSLAHPMGNFSINHYTHMRLERHHIALLYLLDLAEIPTFQEIQEMGFVPEAGHASVVTYLAARVETLQQGLRLEVDGKPVPLHPVSSHVLFPPGAGGLPTLKFGIEYRAVFDTVPDDRYRVSYRDTNFPGRTGWHEIILGASPEVTVEYSSVPDTDRSQALTNYPTDVLQSPPQVLEAQVVFTSSPSLPGAIASSPPPALLAANQPGTRREALTALITMSHLSVGMVGLALLVAAGLGALHALEPGHGKTVVAAYLVGSHGTPRHALALGLIVTLTHTAGVYVLGVLTLYASQYVVPERLYPWLGLISGCLVVALGASLVWHRGVSLIRARRPVTAPHTHGHAHHEAHAHVHAGAHPHDQSHILPHGGLTHPEHAHAHSHHHHSHPHHHTPLDGTVSWRQLLTLGITGGIVPCPAALVVFLSAVSLHRIGFGLLLLVAFSAGLALVLIAIGLLLLYAQRFMARWQGDGPLLQRWLPLTSAALIMCFGILMAVQAIKSAGML